RLVAEGLEMTTPAWSPRGDLIAFLAPIGERAGAHERVWVVPAAGGEPRCLTERLDRSAGGSVMTDMRGTASPRLAWSDEGDRLYFQARGPGVTELHAVALKGGGASELSLAGSR